MVSATKAMLSAPDNAVMLQIYRHNGVRMMRKYFKKETKTASE